MYPCVQEIETMIEDVKDHLDHPVLGDIYKAGVRRCAEVALDAWRGARGVKNFLKKYQQEPEIYELLLQQIQVKSLENEVEFFSICRFKCCKFQSLL